VVVVVMMVMVGEKQDPLLLNSILGVMFGYSTYSGRTGHHKR
jgi:hypothetical protein